jgi:FtsP/CotA-like multicopper oxidase with cupredoxin domain
MGTALSKRSFLFSSFLIFITSQLAFSSSLETSSQTCPGNLRTAASQEESVESPKELVSHKGRLEVSLTLRSARDSTGQTQYCYIDQFGDRSPTLRLRAGDLLVLKLTNEISPEHDTAHDTGHDSGHGHAVAVKHSHSATEVTCASGMMMVDSTNLHFHGLGISPSCHSDDSLHVMIPPSKTFVYRVRIPKNQPAGLYWYHPHPHGHSEEQVLGGASGALIIEGIGAANPKVAGLPERVFVIRDQKLRGQILPDHMRKDEKADPSSSNAPVDASQRDPSIPAKDLSLNFIPITYPEYSVPTIRTRPLTREFWRVLNASADTYVNLGVLFNGEWRGKGLVASHGSWQPLDLVALDGVPIDRMVIERVRISGKSNKSAGKRLPKTEILIPPGGRAEFILQTPAEGTQAELITVGADTNPPVDEDSEPPATSENPLDNAAPSVADNDDNTPPRPLARIVSSPSAVEPHLTEGSRFGSHRPVLQTASLADVRSRRQRKLYFSEKVTDPKHPNTSTVFFLTEEGHTPKAFDPSVMAPDIVVHQGDVEEWTVENRSRESHAFHIHQTHFRLLERDGEAAEENYLLDTVDVPYWDGVATQYPSVKLRMDFRDPNIIGVFPYHCHILQHVDGGMMGLIEVKPKAR